MPKSPEPLVIGLPTNSRIAEDLAPLRDALRLEGSQGVFKSPDIRNAIFRTLRATDIADLLLSATSTMAMGITGQDTMIERSLSYPKGEIDEYLKIDVGEPVSMSVLTRDDPMELKDEYSQTIVTSYPNITKRAVLDPLASHLARRLTIRVVDGKVESLVRSEDFGPTAAGVDIVRSGKTAQEFGLKSLGKPVLISSPALYGYRNYKESWQVYGIIDFLRMTLLQIYKKMPKDGWGFDFQNRLKPWEPLTQ